MSSPRPDAAKNIEFLGYSDQGGRPDGVQVMVNKGYAYVSHPFSGGVTVIDVRDPRNPKTVELSAGASEVLVDCICRPSVISCSSVEEFNFYSVYFKRGGLLRQVDRNWTSSHVRQARRRFLRGACGSTTSQSRPSRRPSDSWRSRASACIACGGSAAATPMRRRCSTATPITS